MAKILGTKTLNLRTRFQIVKVIMDCADFNSDVDYCYVESMVDTHSGLTDFRFIAGLRSQFDDTYCTYWLCSRAPRHGISDKDLQMFRDILFFTTLNF